MMNDASNWFAGCPEGSPGFAYDPTCGVVVFINDPALSVSVYPNPADDYFIVESDIAILSLEIMDLSGKVIYEMNANNALKTIIPTSYLYNGFYLMKLHFEQGERILKFIVQHK
ncbi:MAG: T9SS type A sorting domain-containing protein, partial [Chitinophagales bacterium]|nr:T9SS type A sorting domain-containing protein [Chitinophagales bacterium]